MDENISKNVRDDLILFKNETLKDIKETENQLLEKYSNLKLSILEKIDNFDKQFMKFNQKITEITSFIDSLKDIKNNVNILLANKTKSENTLIDLSFKLKSLDKDYNKSIFNINAILKNSVIYPGIIGGASKFKNFHDIIDYTLSNISHLKIFQEKITKDVNNNKSTCDNNIEKLKNQIDIVFDKTNNIITNEITLIEEKTNSNFKLFNEKLQCIKIENEKNNNNINNELKHLTNHSKEQLKEINNIKKELSLNFNELRDKYNQNNNGINELNEKNSKLNNFMLELNSRIDNSFFNELYMDNKMNKKKDGTHMKSNRFLSANNNDSRKKQFKKFERGFNELMRDKINGQSYQKSPNQNQLYNKENKNNTINNFWGKSQSYKRFPLYKENEKITLQNNILNDMNINNLSERSGYFNSFNNNKITTQNEIVGTSDDSFKIKPFHNLKEKSTYVNLFSSNKYSRTKQLKNISLTENNEILYNVQNNIDNKNEKNLLQENTNNNNINLPKNHKFTSGYPRIVTNQGERILISSHPVYHREKFTNDFNPSTFFTFKNINNNNNKQKQNKNNLNKNIKTFSESKFLDKNNSKNKVINEKSNDYDPYNDNTIFKTLPNPKSYEKMNKKQLMDNKRRNNSYKKNNNYKIKKGK